MLLAFNLVLICWWLPSAIFAVSHNQSKQVLTLISQILVCVFVVFNDGSTYVACTLCVRECSNVDACNIKNTFCIYHAPPYVYKIWDFCRLLELLTANAVSICGQKAINFSRFRNFFICHPTVSSHSFNYMAYSCVIVVVIFCTLHASVHCRSSFLWRFRSNFFHKNGQNKNGVMFYVRCGHKRTRGRFY